MNKIKQILIGVSMIALSGNASAIMMNDDGSRYAAVESIMQEFVTAGSLTADIELIMNKAMKKGRKYDRKAAKLFDGRGNPVKLERKINKLGIKISALMSGLPAASTATINNLIDGGGEGGDNGSIPEPSTIALLGLGLIGIGAARRLRKKAG